MYRRFRVLYNVLLVFSLFTGLNGRVFGQLYNEMPSFLNANRVWAFGRHAGLDFNFTSAQPFESAMNTFVSCASLASPSTGRLQFYSQGNSCFNRDHKPMPNGSNLKGNPFNNGQRADGGTMQGVCILPSIERPGQYYLFSLGATGAGTTAGQLYYSIVDTTLDKGMGDIIPGKRDILLDANLSECMIGVPGNNCDLWLLVHDAGSARFKAYHINYAGINRTPVISNVGTSGVYNLTSLAVSPDRKTLSLVSSTATIFPGSNVAGVQLFRFDPETGIVSDGIRINNKWTYSSGFSADGRFLYVNYNDTNNSSIRQYDISSYNIASIQASEVVIDTFRRNESRALRLYDGKIYVSMMTSGNVGRINSPNLKGLACDFRRTAYTLLPLTESRSGLPAEVVLPFPKDTVRTTLLDTLICSGSGTQDIAPIDLHSRGLTSLFLWDNGSTDPVRRITKRGRYWIFYKGDCNSYVDSFIIGGSDFSFDLGADTTVCAPDSFVLSAQVPGAGRYLWQDSSAGQRYRVDRTGRYWLSVTKDGCTLGDTVRVQYIDVSQHLGPDTAICNDVPMDIELEARIPPEPGTEILWSTGATGSSLQVEDFGIYWIKAQNGICTGGDTITINRISCSCRVDVPTAFSPNYDGHNDVFSPVIENGCIVSSYVLNIYNRWGQLVFTSGSPEAGWDGTFRGAPADIGTYFYTVQFNGSVYKTKYFQKGDLTLIR